MAEQAPDADLHAGEQGRALGAHDENITFERRPSRPSARELASRMRSITSAAVRERRPNMQRRAASSSPTPSSSSASTAMANLRLMDEVLTADSSRFWPADEYAEGISPPSFDKQFVRDWLETQDWDKTPPPPDLPADVVARHCRQVSRGVAAPDGHGSDRRLS